LNYRVLYSRRDRIGELTLNQPPLNILDIETLEELGRRLDELASDDQLQLLWLRAAGEAAFSAGSAVQDHTPERARSMLTTFHRALSTLRRLPAITIAVVRGHCLGGGMELAACCDMVLAADDSRFGQPEVDLGCFPPVAAALYPTRLGGGRTLELLLSGRLLDCGEAERLGLVTWRVPAAQLEGKIQEIGARLTSKSAAVTRRIKRAVQAAHGRSFDEALAETERIYLEDLLRTEDAREGIAAFLAKRSPEWRHR
jgi:cyclohexa-1,5-dienecarbonyl-CoA hydratase